VEPDGLEQVTADRLLEARELELASLTGLQLAAASLAGKRFTRCWFERATLTGADLRNTVLDDVTFHECDLSSAKLAGASLSEVVFRGCKLLGVDWSSVTRSLIGQPLVFEGCQLDFGIFQGMNLRASTFRDCSAREVELSGADLGEATFHGCDLDRARFAATRLVEADLTGARNYELDPRENDVRGLKVDLPEGAALLRAFGVVVEAG
jgi:fluoroquinolone resistance protein